MVTIDRLTEAVCLEDVEDRFVDMCLAADPGMISHDALEDYTVVDQPGNDVDTLAGAGYEGDEIELPDDDGFIPSAYDAMVAAENPEIADEDLPEESEFYGEDDSDEDTVITDEELMAAETVDDMLEMAWQRGQSKTFWEDGLREDLKAAPGEPADDDLFDDKKSTSSSKESAITEGRLAKKLYDKAKEKSSKVKEKKKELGYGGGVGYAMGKAANALDKPFANFGKGFSKGFKSESSILTSEEIEEATRTLAPEEYDSFFEMDASKASREVYDEADTLAAAHEAYMEPITFQQIAETRVEDPNPTEGRQPTSKMPKSKGYK